MEEEYFNKFTDDPRFIFFNKLFQEMITLSEIKCVEYEGKPTIMIQSMNPENYISSKVDEWVYNGLKERIDKLILKNEKKINKWTKTT
jgi:hypothetical protein